VTPKADGAESQTPFRSTLGEVQGEVPQVTWAPRARSDHGASDDDPSGLPRSPGRGKSTDRRFLWTVVLTLPLMMGVRRFAIGQLWRPKRPGRTCHQTLWSSGPPIIGVLLVILIIANTLNIAADLVAIGSGMTY